MVRLRRELQNLHHLGRAIVETTNFNGKHQQVGRPRRSSGEQLSLTERFTRLDAETLVYEYTVTDPATWVTPWTAQVPMKKRFLTQMYARFWNDLADHASA